MANLKIETMAGVKSVELTVKDGKVRLATVNMGRPVLLSRGANLEVTPAQKADLSPEQIFEPLDVLGETWRMIPISMGNPHAVFFVGDVDGLDIQKYGPLIEKHPRFVDRTNVEFVQLVDEGTVRMRVWERGSGETMACGTGACATAVACTLAGYTDNQTDVKLLGGTLQIHWDEDDGHVDMCGPATEVFTGEFNV